MMPAYYNEFDPFSAAWLRELIKDGLISDGEVDDRSITEVDAADLRGFTQHHFCAGIGGWSYALRLAGWSDDRPVCTASLPCQPFSVAGQQQGKDDERHLLPHFMQLMREYGKFDTIMGEQVEGAVRHGWLDDLQTNMEAEGYSTGAVVLGAHSIGAPHQRQRIFWVSSRMGNTDSNRCETGCETTASARHRGSDDAAGGVAGRGMAHHQRQSGSGELGGPVYSASSEDREVHVSGVDYSRSKGAYCRDGKYRKIPIEPSFFPLVDGVPPARVGILRGAGNAIVPQVAAEVIKAYMEGE